MVQQIVADIINTVREILLAYNLLFASGNLKLDFRLVKLYNITLIAFAKLDVDGVVDFLVL